MIKKKTHYLRVLTVELQDLIEDIDQRIATQKARLEEGGITDYVYRENVALLTAERHALERFIEELGRFDSSPYKDLKELEAEIEKKFVLFLEEHEFPHAIENFVTRKMKKVLQFCQCE